MDHEEVPEWDRDAWDLDPDSVALALTVVAPPTMGKIMREAFYGTRRFDDFLRRTGMSPAALSARLRELVAQELLVKVPYREPGALEGEVVGEALGDVGDQRPGEHLARGVAHHRGVRRRHDRRPLLVGQPRQCEVLLPTAAPM